MPVPHCHSQFTFGQQPKGENSSFSHSCCRNICQTGHEAWVKQTPTHSWIFLGLNTQEALIEIFVINSANTMQRLLKHIWQIVSSHNKKSVSQHSTYRFYFTQRAMRLRGGSRKVNSVNEARNHPHQKSWIMPESSLVLESFLLSGLTISFYKSWGIRKELFTKDSSEHTSSISKQISINFISMWPSFHIDGWQ